MKKRNVALVVCAIFIILMVCLANAYADISVEERSALISLYNSTDGDNWKKNSGWKTPPLHTDGFSMPGTEINWFGITINKSNNVVRIELKHNKLGGTLPTEIGKLKQLVFLRLRYNNLKGKIPVQIGDLVTLRELMLGNNQLKGKIPTEIGNLINLIELDLSENQLSGKIPSEIGKLNEIDYIRLRDNKLTGKIPPEIGNLKKMRRLMLRNNQLKGKIPPEIRGLINLRGLDIANNKLTGRIPPEIGNLENLTRITLYNNRLTGNIPPEIGKLKKLESLDLENNKLTGIVPPEVKELNLFNRIKLKDNKLSEMDVTRYLIGGGFKKDKVQFLIPTDWKVVDSIEVDYAKFGNTGIDMIIHKEGSGFILFNTGLSLKFNKKKIEKENQKLIKASVDSSKKMLKQIKKGLIENGKPAETVLDYMDGFEVTVEKLDYNLDIAGMVQIHSITRAKHKSEEPNLLHSAQLIGGYIYEKKYYFIMFYFHGFEKSAQENMDVVNNIISSINKNLN